MDDLLMTIGANAPPGSSPARAVNPARKETSGSGSFEEMLRSRSESEPVAHEADKRPAAARQSRRDQRMYDRQAAREAGARPESSFTVNEPPDQPSQPVDQQDPAAKPESGTPVGEADRGTEPTDQTAAEAEAKAAELANQAAWIAANTPAQVVEEAEPAVSQSAAEGVAAAGGSALNVEWLSDPALEAALPGMAGPGNPLPEAMQRTEADGAALLAAAQGKQAQVEAAQASDAVQVNPEVPNANTVQDANPTPLQSAALAQAVVENHGVETSAADPAAAIGATNNTSGTGLIEPTRQSTQAGMAAAPETVRAQEMIAQVTRAMDTMVRSGQNWMRVQLFPEELGRIDLRMVNGANGMTVTLIAEQATTGKVLESQINSLRQVLSEAGIQLAHLGVGNGSSQGHLQQGSGQQGGHSSSHNHPNGANGRLYNGPAVSSGASSNGVSGQQSASGVDYLI